MSFDLYFCRQNGSAPSIPELKQYFSAIPFFQVSDVAEGGVQFWYQNEATGVYCDFSYSPLDANELKGCGSSGLSFNLNYVRPSFFAYGVAPLIQTLHLEPIDLSQHTRMASDGFHDVAAPGEVPE